MKSTALIHLDSELQKIGFAPLSLVEAKAPVMLSQMTHMEKTSLPDGVQKIELLPWSVAEVKARSVLSQMTSMEQRRLLSGVHFGQLGPEPGYYIGNVPGIPRLGVPPLKMQDAGQGFRPTARGELGTTTCWPSLLALAATWDTALVTEVAAAIGQEFSGKGANVILGPSINVNRVARNGRNFEYLSGEDPYLGARLTHAYVEGVQSQGVMAVAKHFAFNEQETNRMIESSNVDAMTAWELYYPPFQAAVDAGVGAFMCAYNRVNGTYACENQELLNRDLKHSMGFRGFVMSDWAATHSTSVASGLDMDMPGNDGYFGITALSPISQMSVEGAALRVLASIYHLRLDGQVGCIPPNCTMALQSNQRRPSHSNLARVAATNAVTLLKNDGVLPLTSDRVRTIAVLGSVADARQRAWFPDYYSGGGSGHVVPYLVSTPLRAIKQRAATANIQVIANTNDSVAEALQLVRSSKVDVVVVFAGTLATEGFDRANLALDHNIDKLITVMAKIKPTVVLMQTPGAVLTPWRHKISAVANLFYGGEETGNAWAAVLFGDVSPAGKLPVMFPAGVNDAIPPSPLYDIPYSERCNTSYRSPTFRAAFPFGHGLSYTHFSFSELKVLAGKTHRCIVGLVCIQFTITNMGARPGVEVAQAYFQFPTVPEAPQLSLRGFWKTKVLNPGDTEEVLFSFSTRELSVYRAGIGFELQGAVEAHIGVSSKEIREVVSLRIVTDQQH